MKRVEIRAVTNKADQRAFLKVPFSLYGKNDHWVAPLFVERFDHLDIQKNPYFLHARAQLFLALRDGKPVGRISAQHDHLRLQYHPDATGQFGFLEAIDNFEVFSALLNAAGNWLKQFGYQTIQGPYDFSINDQMGLLIEGFDRPANIMMGHAQPYYASQLAACGFYKAKDVYAYFYDARLALPTAMNSLYEKTIKSDDILIRPIDKKHLKRDLDYIIAIFNDAWSHNWGFVPFTKEELEKLANVLKLLISDDYCALAFYKGEPAAMAVSLPNLNEWISDLGGKLLPFGWAKLGWRMFTRSPHSVRMPLMGVLRKFHASILGASLSLGVIETVRRAHLKRGTHYAELSWILEENKPMRALIESLGAVPYKTYRIYEKNLS